MKPITTSVLFLFFSTTLLAENNFEIYTQIKDSDTLVMIGKVIKKKNSQNKNEFNYFFKTATKTYSINLSKSVVTKEQLNEMILIDSRPKAEYQDRRFKVVREKIKNGESIAIIQELRRD